MSYGKAAHDDGYVEEDNDEKDGEYEKSTQKKKKKKQKGRCSPASFSSASAFPAKLPFCSIFFFLVLLILR